MKASQFFISTQKEAPADAQIVSHQLMMRAGMIKKLGAGIYNYMPMGLRVIRKVEAIVREEMNRAGALELVMPMVQPAELWQETGRWDKMGAELLRFKDRHGADFALQPTSEEVITDIARSEIRSYKQMPVNFYQIQSKFRDERRPRFGVMRGREFTMKDAYSFDRDEAGMKQSYAKMVEAYNRIFTRFGLTYRAVAADNGAIGGSGSQEFHVIAETGEDAIVYCPNSDYAANLEAAEAIACVASRAAASAAMQKVDTPKQTKCEDVAALLGVPLQQTVKTVVYATEFHQEQLPGTYDSQESKYKLEVSLWAVLVRGDHEVNEVKLGKVFGLQNGFRPATEEEIRGVFECPPGFIGPVFSEGNKPYNLQILADRTVANMSDFICGANAPKLHLQGVNWGRDLPEPDLVADLRNVVQGDTSPDGKGTLEICRGIEVGHVFMLGTNYSQSMNATYLDENGKSQTMVMGCYGIGVTRILGAAIEQNFDARGIIWPTAIAPFEVVLCPVGYDRSEEVKQAADQLYNDLKAQGVDVMLDDRGERPGAMFADWELIGVPHRVVIGDRGLKEGKVEVQGRREAEATHIALSDVVAQVKARLQA